MIHLSHMRLKAYTPKFYMGRILPFFYVLLNYAFGAYLRTLYYAGMAESFPVPLAKPVGYPNLN